MMLWDVFCRVVDNYGDIGVCWRLAAGLAARGESVRLWTDDASALAWMAPGGCSGVEVLGWDSAAPPPGEVVIEAFGCDPPPRFVARMHERPPVWINLEHLSAEPYVERSHGLPSPRGLVKWFYYPGYTPRTGGLLREPGLLEARGHHDADAWLRARGWPRAAGERVVSLFCYAHAPVEALADALAAQPTLLLVAPGAAAPRAGAGRGALRVARLRHLTQHDFDRLLWSCDLNFVRGEDTPVRAAWAGAPLVWQPYRQHDGAHAAKLEAWLDLLLDGADAPLAAALRALHRGWSALAPFAADPAAWPDAAAWRALMQRWRAGLAAQPDLVTQLRAFVAARR